MTDGFDLDSPLVCEGIIGDGCGGGRLFFVDENSLKTYDPLTKKSRILLSDVFNAQSISKSGCIITIKYPLNYICFDLSCVSS